MAVRSPYDRYLFTPNRTDGFIADGWDNFVEEVMREKGIPGRGDFDPYENFYRVKPWKIYDSPSEIGKEYLFFVKPDLYIANGYVRDGSVTLQSDVARLPFFRELASKWPNVIAQLQYQADPTGNPFSMLLSNMVESNLDLPSLSANTITPATNIFGTNYEYRGTSEPSDDNYDFSLEFSDTRWLDVYMYFRTYEEYERLKAQGVIDLNKAPAYAGYINNKILHDQIGIYKFIVGEDFETIIYYAYLCGVIWKSLPRDSFNNADFSDGIRYGIDAKAAFVDDDPMVLRDFQLLCNRYRLASEYAPLVDMNKSDEVDMKPVNIPEIYESTLHGRKVYKLRFKRKANMKRW